jgi:hypothetical protein
VLPVLSPCDSLTNVVTHVCVKGMPDYRREMYTCGSKAFGDKRQGQCGHAGRSPLPKHLYCLWRVACSWIVHQWLPEPFLLQYSTVCSMQAEATDIPAAAQNMQAVKWTCYKKAFWEQQDLTCTVQAVDCGRICSCLHFPKLCYAQNSRAAANMDTRQYPGGSNQHMPSCI